MLQTLDLPNLFSFYLNKKNIYKTGILSLIFCLVFINTSFKLNNYKINVQDSLNIIEKPINYTLERKKLSLEYLKERHGIVKLEPTITPKIVVLHYTDGGTINTIYNYFNQPKIEAKRSFNKQQSSLNVGAHYLVDRDGTIYHLIPDTLFARHIIGLNYCAIGIENIGSRKNPLTKAQVTANANLVKHLYIKHQIEYIIGHSEYVNFRNSNLWKETNKNYYTDKGDPGKEFLIEVRKLIKDINVKSKP